MKRGAMNTLWAGLALACALPLAALAQAPASPAQLYGELYRRVEMQHCYPDSKTFADATALAPAAQIMAAFAKQNPADCAALKAFAQERFALPQDAAVPAAAQRKPLAQHIADLWPQLLREPVQAQAGSSQLPFAFKHVVPGGRFREIYYWDTYFTLLGLKLDGHGDAAQAMVDGFADLIVRYGHVPNGTRSYYLSRSQPPFFYMMVSLMTPQKPELAYGHYLAALKREHAFWMDGEQGLKPGAAAKHVVKLADGSVLNRYWDASDAPRDESYREDVELAQQAGRAAPELYREIRSAAESGWDFSSRWFADGKSLATIETTAILPVDLNALLFGLERAIAQGCAAQKDADCAMAYGQRAAQRRAAMNQHLWNARAGAYYDLQWRKNAATGRLSAATLYPLFTGAADAQQAAAVARTVQAQLLRKGGLATTTAKTGQQWDEPNGWPPLQWIGVQGLRRYGEDALARDIAQRWLQTVQIHFAERGKLVEKYDVDTQAPGSGGEYPTQDGFGWTNGVTRALIEQYGETQQ